MRTHFAWPIFAKLAGLVMVLFSLLLMLSSTSIRADDKPVQPERKDLLPVIQKGAGKDWVVTEVPEGFLLTYTPPVLFYPTNGATPKPEQLAAEGKPSHLCLKIVFGRPATAEDLEHAKSPYSERQEAPMEPSVRQKLKDDHFYVCSPSTWANGPKYTVFIATNMPPENNVFPRTATDSVDHVLFELGELFHF